MASRVQSVPQAPAVGAGIVGGTVWVAALIALPAPLVVRIFLAAPLVVVPALLALLPARPLGAALGTRDLVPWPALAAGIALGMSFVVGPGPAALALATAWIALTAACGLAALRHGLPRLRGLFMPSNASELATDGALGFLAVGGLFLLADRAPLELPGLRSSLSLLGAVHYHFAGFGLLALVAQTRAASRRVAYVAAVALVAGMPLSGVAITSGEPLVNLAAVLVLAAGGLGTALLLTRAAALVGDARRPLLLLAGTCLIAGMSLGVGWASAPVLGFAFLGAEEMVRIHGALNCLAVVLGAIVVGRREPAG